MPLSWFAWPAAAPTSLWLSDHLLIPPGDFIPHGHQPDPLAMLGWLAAATERVGIGTSVLVLPYRDPVVVAKAAGTACRAAA